VSQKWEYWVKEIKTVDANATKTLLDESGEDGWELVAVRNEFYYFKRPKMKAGTQATPAKSVGRMFRSPRND
jgi:hypothetical protein